MIIGFTVGGLYNAVTIQVMNRTIESYHVAPLLIGAAAMLAGSLRLSYSIIVIIIEMSLAFQLLFPLVVAVSISMFVADLINLGFLHKSLRADQFPILRDIAPDLTANLKAETIMSKNLITLPSIADMKSLKEALRSSHQCFPVLNLSGNLVGIVSKTILVPLCEKKIFY